MDRDLEPAHRFNEVLGLVMALTFKLTADLALGEAPRRRSAGELLGQGVVALDGDLA